MSKENAETIEVYEKFGENYVGRDKTEMENNPKAREDDAYQQQLLREYTENLPKDARIFEVGSGTGRDAKRFKNLGFENIVVSDVPEFFLNYLKNEGFNPLKFDLIHDEFPEKYDFIFCWAVLVHFTKDEAISALKKMYGALNPGGRLAFSVKRKTDVDAEWADHKGKIGAKRYFSYWIIEELEETCKKIGFENISISHRDGARAAWIECCAYKPAKA